MKNFFCIDWDRGLLGSIQKTFFKFKKNIFYIWLLGSDISGVQRGHSTGQKNQARPHIFK